MQNGNKLKRADATRIALIEAAERLIAEKGLADVSTREILQEAGQRNQSALQYHFGSKKGLISATINERTKQIDRVRQEMLEKVGDNPSMRQLIEVLIMPLADLMREKAAGANYLNFLSQAITQPEWELRRVLEEFNVVGMLKAYELLDAKFENMSEKERFNSPIRSVRLCHIGAQSLVSGRKTRAISGGHIEVCYRRLARPGETGLEEVGLAA